MLTPSSPFRGYCLYKTGKCPNERALKANGQAHNLCKDHRLKQNQNQRRMDNKLRRRRPCHFTPYQTPPTAPHWSCPSPPYYHHLSPSPIPDHLSPSPFHDQLSPSSMALLPRRVEQDALEWITVPMPSCLRGPEREALRARVVHKLFEVLALDDVPYTAIASMPYEKMAPSPPRLPSLAERRLHQILGHNAS